MRSTLGQLFAALEFSDAEISQFKAEAALAAA